MMKGSTASDAGEARLWKGDSQLVGAEIRGVAFRHSASLTCVGLACEGEECFMLKFSQVLRVTPGTWPYPGIGGLAAAARIPC